MKLYMSFGFVRDDGVSERLFHLEQPMDKDVMNKLVAFIKDQIFNII